MNLLILTWILCYRWESTTLTISYETPLGVIEQLKTRLQSYVNENNREWNGVAVNIDKMEYQNAITVIVGMERESSSKLGSLI